MVTVPRASSIFIGGLIALFASLAEWRSLEGVEAWEDSGWGEARERYPGVAKPKPKPSLKWKPRQGTWDDPAWGGTGGYIYPGGHIEYPNKPIKPMPSSSDNEWKLGQRDWDDPAWGNTGRASYPDWTKVHTNPDRGWELGKPDWTKSIPNPTDKRRRPSKPDWTKPLPNSIDSGWELGKPDWTKPIPRPTRKPRPWPFPIWRTPAWHLHAPGSITPFMPSEDKSMERSGNGADSGSGSGVSGRFLFPSRSWGWKNVAGTTTTHEEGGKTWYGGQNYTLETIVESETTQHEEGEEIKRYYFGKRRKKRGIPLGIRLPLRN